MNYEKLMKLREPFPAHQISLLPKPYKKDSEKGKCGECGGYHGLPAVHLKYVGHAALTDRLLEVDPLWSWEPLAYKDGLPAFDEHGGLWIKLTVCGHTRLGYGNAENSNFKDAGAREKEVIGDALRNAAMRFGAALELWHKGDLHLEGEEPWIIQPGEDEGDGGANPRKYLIPFGSNKNRSLEEVFKNQGPDAIVKSIELTEKNIDANTPYKGFTIEQMKDYVFHASKFMAEMESVTVENLPF